MDNGKDCVLDEAFVYMTSGEKFANELKLGNQGFVDVPVGDYKISRLHANSLSCVPGAPSAHYTQTEGKDLCISKLLASAFHAIGFKKMGSKINTFGEERLEGAVVDALEQVKKQAKAILPTWIVIDRLPKNLIGKKI